MVHCDVGDPLIAMPALLREWFIVMYTTVVIDLPLYFLSFIDSKLAVTVVVEMEVVRFRSEIKFEEAHQLPEWSAPNRFLTLES